MWNLKLYPYKVGSESATELANMLDIMRVKPDGNYVPKIGHKVINWGMGKIPNWSELATRRGVTMLNKPNAVNTASNKLLALQALKAAGVKIPEFTTDYYEAMRWLNAHAVVVERHELRGNSGEGIRIVTLDDPEMETRLQQAPLYTKFIPKTTEFRVHVFQGQVIDYIEKKKKLADQRPANFNKYISSINLGWVFQRTNILDLPEVRNLAIKAVAALGLDFGAVDIVYCDGIPYVLEVNTAPGLSGETLIKYANAFRRFMGVPVVADTAPISGAAIQQSRTAVGTSLPQTAGEIGAMNEIVTLRISRADAIRLRSLLSQAIG